MTWSGSRPKFGSMTRKELAAAALAGDKQAAAAWRELEAALPKWQLDGSGRQPMHWGDWVAEIGYERAKMAADAGYLHRKTSEPIAGVTQYPDPNSFDGRVSQWLSGDPVKASDIAVKVGSWYGPVGFALKRLAAAGLARRTEQGWVAA